MAGSLWADPPPVLFPLSGLPPNTLRCAAMAETARGWVVATAEGVLCQRGEGWVLERVPGVSEVTVVVPWRAGFLAAGRGFCQTFDGQGWQALALDDEIYTGISFEGAAFLSGRKGVYRVPENSGTECVLPSSLAESNVYLHIIRGDLYAFTVDRGVLVWRKAAFQVAEHMDWAKDASVVSVQDCGEGRLFAATTKGLFAIDGARATSICPNQFAKILDHKVVAAFLFGDQVIAIMYHGGVAAISVPRDDLDWRVTKYDLGGSPYFARVYLGGLIVGHSSGISVLHDLQRFSATALPQGDLLFVAPLSDGLRIGSTTGVATASGKRAISYQDMVRVDTIRSLAETKDGKVAKGHFGKLDLGGKMIELGGREVSAIAVTPKGRVAIMQPHGVSRLADDGTPQLLRIDALPTSLSADGDCFVVGTSQGALTFSADGAMQTRFGHGMTKVFPVGERTVAVDSDGEVFSGQGLRLSRTPPGEAVGAAEWRGQLYILTRLNDGGDWLGRIDLEKKSWVPLDVPLPPSPRSLVVERDQLIVVTPQTLFAINAADALPPPPLALKFSHKDGRPMADNASLSANENDLEIRFPSNRLGGWRNPAYRIRVNDGPWEPVTADRMEVPRLSWGRNRIAVSASWAGLAASTEWPVYHARPWWATWPMASVYGLAGAATILGLVRGRTRMLANRAAKLDRMVSARTAELVQRTTELKKANQAKDEFLSSISHEIRNPLNGICGLADLTARSENLSPKERMRLQVLLGCTSQLRTLLDDVLDFRRIESGQIALKEEPFDAVVAVRDAAVMVDYEFNRCTLHSHKADGWLLGDVGKIRQIVINLVSNALKYGVPPRATIEVETKPLDTGKIRYTITVGNTGPTIPPAELDRIFESFIRGSDAVARKIAGAGVGLAISKRLADAMGGQLTVQSQDGQTRFTLTVELAPAPASPDENGPVEEETDDVEYKGRALVVDDDQFNLDVIQPMLEDMGYMVESSTSANLALKYAQNAKSYALVLTDLSMPEMSGLEFAQQLRKALVSVGPIIAVSAFSTQEKRDTAKAAGIDGYVVKPVSRAKLEQAIASINGSSGFGPAEAKIRDELGAFKYLKEYKHLAPFIEHLPQQWGEISRHLNDETNALDDVAAQKVHAVIGLVGWAYNQELSESVLALEKAVRRSDRAAVRALVVQIEATVPNLIARARAVLEGN